jgi:hypothetical protein
VPLSDPGVLSWIAAWRTGHEPSIRLVVRPRGRPRVRGRVAVTAVGAAGTDGAHGSDSPHGEMPPDGGSPDSRVTVIVLFWPPAPYSCSPACGAAVS